MPEQQSLAIEPAAPVAPPPAPKAPVKRFELPAESKPEAKAPEKVAEAPAPPAQKAEEAPAPETEEVEEKKELTPEEVEKRRESRRFERRIDKLTRRAAEAQARAELAEKRLGEQSQPKAPTDDSAPKLEQFDYDPEKYAAAKAEYEKKKYAKEYEEKQRTEAVGKNREKLVSAWEEKAEKAADKYDDFSTVVGEMQPTNPLTQAIMESDPDVAYYLGKHPKEVERIAALGPVAQVLAIGKLEAKLAATPEKPKAPSKAPEPIKPLSGAGSTATDVPSEQDDMKAWIRKRSKQVRGK